MLQNCSECPTLAFWPAQMLLVIPYHELLFSKGRKKQLSECADGFPNDSYINITDPE
jgi:hypothetical protein